MSGSSGPSAHVRFGYRTLECLSKVINQLVWRVCCRCLTIVTADHCAGHLCEGGAGRGEGGRGKEVESKEGKGEDGERKSCMVRE